MADGEETESENMRAEEDQEDVFSNGEADSLRNSALLHPEYGNLPEQVIPRRSSLIKDTSRRSQGQRKKTVSFSSMPNERTVINVPDCLNFMQNGSELIKVRSNSRQYHRTFTLDEGLSEIRWQPSSKKPQKARIQVDQVKEVRLGKNTDILRNKDIAGHHPDECAFSIIYGDSFDTMDLIANTPDEANIWVTGLTCLITGKNRSPEIDLRDKWLQQEFDGAELDNTGLLDEFEAMKLMRKINKGIAPVKLQQKLKELSLTKDGERGRLNSSEFINLFKEVSTRPEIYFLLVRYATNADHMSTDDLLLFLEAEQGMTRVTKDKCLAIIERFEPSTEDKKLGQLGIDGFTAYLLSEECDIFDPEHLSVCQDMTQPLSHYFIASSHNTYLLEDQLRGPSSVEGYIRALKKGCRCVELDCWDGNDDPVIYHGHTLTSKISFKSVIEAINEYAFVASEYPVILSIENHCSIKQQQAMAHYMKTILSTKLYIKPVNENSSYLPSPESFKGKIIIKCKKLASTDKEEGYVTEEDEGAETEKSKKNNKKEGSMKKRKMVKELSDLVNYCKSVRFKDFQASAEEGKCYELCSLTESVALKMANGCPEEFVNHNKRFLSRIYPTGMRIDSSNYNPQDLWNCGCQLVSLNYQTPGLMMDLNDGHYMRNGGCGYVMKPAIMRDEIAFFSANTKEVIPGVSPQVLHVKVISGQQLPKPKGSGAKGDTIDPYVTVEIFGIPADCAEERTKTVQHNGYNPIFDESFEFQINLPELALVRFTVLDDDFIGDEFIGQYTTAFECMQTGYRHFRLKSSMGEPMKTQSTLFVHVAITNKRGGGKTTRRGMSVRRYKANKEYTSMKSIGIKSIDETFRIAIQPLRDGADLRDSVQVALAQFKEHCGLAPISNLKQCIRMLVTRIQSSCDSTSLQLVKRGEYPYLEAQGSLPDMLRKALVCFDHLVCQCKDLIARADDVHDRILHAQQAGLEWHEDLQNTAVQQGLKGKKLNKAMENFAWNIRVLKGQADLIQRARLEAMEYMMQVQEAAVSMGLTADSTATDATRAAAANQNANNHQHTYCSSPDSSPTADTPPHGAQTFHTAATAASPGSSASLSDAEMTNDNNNAQSMDSTDASTLAAVTTTTSADAQTSAVVTVTSTDALTPTEIVTATSTDAPTPTGVVTATSTDDALTPTGVVTATSTDAALTPTGVVTSTSTDALTPAGVTTATSREAQTAAPTQPIPAGSAGSSPSNSTDSVHSASQESKS